MKTRFTITASFALAAATILAVAACGSSVSGSAQPNAVAAATAQVPSELSELTSLLSEIPTDISIPDLTIPTDLSFPTDLSIPTDLTFPTDFTIPTELGDLTNLSIPGYNSDCLSVASAYASISLALLPALFGGTEAFNAGELQSTLDSLSGQVPADLAPDIQALGEVATEASGKSLTDAASLFESEKFTTAQNNIDAWLTANCN